MSMKMRLWVREILRCYWRIGRCERDRLAAWNPQGIELNRLGALSEPRLTIP